MHLWENVCILMLLWFVSFVIKYKGHSLTISVSECNVQFGGKNKINKYI